MKIGTLTSPPVATDTASAAATAAKSAKSSASTSTAAAAPSDPGTQVELSPVAAQMTSQSSDATFDSAKVSRIASAIRDGKFTINAGSIADKLISNAQELLGRSNAH